MSCRLFSAAQVDVKLGAKADAPTFPHVGLKSPKGAAGLGDSALNFVDVGLKRQGASQVSQFIHIIDHFTVHRSLRCCVSGGAYQGRVGTRLRFSWC